MLQPGVSKETTVTLKNNEKTSLRVKPITLMAQSGGNIVDPVWIKVTPESAEIPAGGSQEFTIKVSAPVYAPTGSSGVQIVFIGPSSPFPDHIHALQVSLDIRATPDLQKITPYTSVNPGENSDRTKIYRNINEIGKMNSKATVYPNIPGEVSSQDTGSIIKGIITSSNGTPVANAYVHAQGSDYGITITDANGNYSFDGFPSGDYIISVSPPYGSNLITNSTITHVSQNETVIANIILQDGGIITGIVTSSNGTPVADAYVFAEGSGYGSASTDINGHYILGGLQAGNYIISVSLPYESNFFSNPAIVHVSQDEILPILSRKTEA